MNQFKSPAVPLVTIDPFFSIWSFSDKLTDDSPRHWSGYRNAMTGLVSIDGKWYRFMGKVQTDNRLYFSEPDALIQKSVRVLPTRTIYNFENDMISIEIEFTSPLLTNDLMLMSRPVSYISYKIKANDTQKHNFKLYFDIGMECCVKNTEDIVEYKITKDYVCCGKGNRDVLQESGDMIPGSWGTLYLSSDNVKYFVLPAWERKMLVSGLDYRSLEGSFTRAADDFPSIACIKNFDDTSSADGIVYIAYDDIYSLEYMGERVPAYWKKNGATILDALEHAKNEYNSIHEKCIKFDDELLTESKSISTKYAEIVSLAYRQVIAAHKLVEIDGKPMFFSKECGSNGCMGTVDITYPSIPMFLKYNPKLAESMLNPIFDYAQSGMWNYNFAPHDIGEYPFANGQVYGLNRKTGVIADNLQMPVEECGNVILCTAAICKAENNTEYARKHKELLQKWADYLVSVGYDPDNQLCTDDFAGHLAHNCNLSIKAILAIAAWGKLLDEISSDGQLYTEKAIEYAKLWESAALDGDHYRLAFDKQGTWSLKYNLVWDKYLSLNIFSENVFEKELNYYKTKFNRYGIPLDSRASYTKSDWQMWVSCLCDDKDFQNKIIEKMWDMLCDTHDRVPFTDWYETEVPRQKSFQARSVQGGLFLPLLHL